MEKQLLRKEINELFEAILTLRSLKECRTFFRDLCTLSEIEEMAERFQIAKLLRNKLPYRQIGKKTNSSPTTVSRVAHWFHHGEGGYKLVLGRLK